jgi:hypothetical protein
VREVRGRERDAESATRQLRSARVTLQDRLDMAPDNLFPSIGTLAQQADCSADPVNLYDTTDALSKDDDDRVVEEVESLCMNCEEQVSTNLLTH